MTADAIAGADLMQRRLLASGGPVVVIHPTREPGRQDVRKARSGRLGYMQKKHGGGGVIAPAGDRRRIGRPDGVQNRRLRHTWN